MTPLTFDDDTIRSAFSDAYDERLDNNERAAFESHLARSSIAAEDYASFVDALTALANTRQHTAPDDHVQSVLAAVAGNAMLEPSHAPWNLWTHAAAAVLGAAACLAAVVVLETDDVPSASDAGLVEVVAPEPLPEPSDDIPPAPAEATPAPDVTPADTQLAEASEPAAEAITPPKTAVAAVPAPVTPPAPLIDLRIDGRRLAATWAGLRDDIADLLADAQTPTPAAVPEPTVTRPEPEALPAASLVAVIDPASFEWPAALRETSAPLDTPVETMPAPTRKPLATLASSTAPARDGVRLVAIDDQISSLRSRGSLLNVVPTLIAHLGDDDDPATTMAADQLAEIAAQLTANPRFGPRLRTPRYVEPETDTWFTDWFSSTPEEPFTHDGTSSSYWSAWHLANADLLAALDRAGEA